MKVHSREMTNTYLLAREKTTKKRNKGVKCCAKMEGRGEKLSGNKDVEIEIRSKTGLLPSFSSQP